MTEMSGKLKLHQKIEFGCHQQLEMVTKHENAIKGKQENQLSDLKIIFDKFAEILQKRKNETQMKSVQNTPDQPKMEKFLEMKQVTGCEFSQNAVVWPTIEDVQNLDFENTRISKIEWYQ